MSMIPPSLDVRGIADLVATPEEAIALGLRQGVVQSVTWNAGLAAQPSVTIRLGGSTTDISNVRFLSSYSPVPGETVWVIRNRTDLIVIGSIQRSSEVASSFTPVVKLGGVNVFSAGTGGAVGRYRRTGSIVHFWIYFVYGIGNVVTAGALTIGGFPLVWGGDNNVGWPMGTARYLRSGVGRGTYFVINSGTTEITMLTSFGFGDSGVSNTSPHSPAASDSWQIQGWYFVDTGQ